MQPDDKTKEAVTEEPVEQAVCEKPADEADKPEKETMAEAAKKGADNFTNAKERLYDKIPVTYKQMDIIVKVLIAAFVVFVIYLVATSPTLRG